LIDDNIQPTMEGAERLHVLLSSPDGATLSEPGRATVVIDDSTSDIPTFEFDEATAKVPENETLAHVAVLRHGDTQAHASVKCFTRSRSAKPVEDYVERARVEGSRVEFKPGQVASNCSVRIVDDAVYEGEEDFILVLTEPVYVDGDQSKLALIGDRAMMRVYVVDEEDTPRIEFEKDVYVVDDDEEAARTVNILVKLFYFSLN
jgi:Calx-beta domain